MSTNSSDPNSSRPGGLFSRLRGMVQPAKPAEEPAEGQPSNLDVPVPQAGQPATVAVAPSTAAASAAQTCPLCQSPRKGPAPYCEDCGFIFPAAGQAVVSPGPVVGVAPSGRIKGRYQVGERLCERCGIERFKGLDYGVDGSRTAVPVVVVRARAAEIPSAEPNLELLTSSEDDFMPTFDGVPMAGEAVAALPEGPTTWPSVGWERALLDQVEHPFFPAWTDNFVEGGYEYLIEEVPSGQSLWDAWDAPESTVAMRFGWLKQIAGALQKLHKNGAILEAIRPSLVIVAPDGQARLNDISDLLPLPLPPSAPVRGTFYTAPELAACSKNLDARASLYSFGAMIYALFEQHELTEMDFDRNGSPKPILGRYPDIHPLMFRLLSKTFVRDTGYRFPSDEASKEDPTGFAELIRVLDLCGRTLDQVRLEMAAWTTTGIVRTGNEDAFAYFHSVESRQDDVHDSALIFLADGMGGYEAGEVASAMCMQILRKILVPLKPFSQAAGQSAFPDDPKAPGSSGWEPLNVEECKRVLAAALKEANKQIFTASRSGGKRRTMGCTAEVVFVDGRNIVVGHVGDSRTYHFHEGQVVQLTRDHTLVNRLVELGRLTPEEAENHPDKNQLQQAVGGQPDVEPGLYHAVLKQGDWVVVCSDGLINHVTNDMLREMLQLEAISADMAARRLTNLVNVKGATDNSTVVVIRAT